MGSNDTSNLSSDDEACLYALRLVTLSALPMTLYAATELNLLDIITGAGPGAHLSPSQIVAKLPSVSNPQAAAETVDRMLRLLAAYDVVSLSGTRTDSGHQIERRYGAAPVTKYLSKDEEGITLALLGQLIHGQPLMQSWYHLKSAVLEGENPFTKAHGMPLFEYGHAHPEFNTFFNEVMTNNSHIVLKKTFEVYKGFHSINVLVDVGGGTGATLSMILAEHPRIRGINFDQPHVISEAPSLSGIEHIGGDMFDSVPSGDAILMKYILHDWDDEHCVKILKNCLKALPKNGKAIILEGNLPMGAEAPTPAEKYTIHLDLSMLVQTHNGKERTEKEFETLAKLAGFSGFQKVSTCAALCIMEMYK